MFPHLLTGTGQIRSISYLGQVKLGAKENHLIKVNDIQTLADDTVVLYREPVDWAGTIPGTVNQIHWHSVNLEDLI